MKHYSNVKYVDNLPDHGSVRTMKKEESDFMDV